MPGTLNNLDIFWINFWRCFWRAFSRSHNIKFYCRPLAVTAVDRLEFLRRKTTHFNQVVSGTLSSTSGFSYPRALSGIANNVAGAPSLTHQCNNEVVETLPFMRLRKLSVSVEPRRS